VACGSSEAERPPSEAQRPGTGAEATPVDGPFGQVGGWIAYNDGTGIWAFNLRKVYAGVFAGVFSPSDNPAPDAVRLAGPAAGDPIAWSAHGSRLLVRRRPASTGSGNALFVLDADGTETRVIGSVRGWSGAWGGASISPDGTRVVYASGHHASRLELATVGDGPPPEVLLSSDGGHLDSPAFSPEGGRIAYIAGGGDHHNALWVIGADGTNRRKLAGGDWSHVDHLVWSPDGERLAFSCRCPAGTGVYTIRADGSRLTLVSANPEGMSMPVPQWSPDGSQIAFVYEDDVGVTVGSGQPTTGTLVVVGAEGGEERQPIRFLLFRMDDLGNVRQLAIAWNPARNYLLDN
jgi:Tol biopolymer transport system component